MASRDSTVPPYLVLAGELNEFIASQELPAHTLLPSERELAETYSVSRMTARKAVALLESEGKVYRRPPRGTFVAESRVAFRVGSFSREVRELGREPAARMLSAVEIPASAEVREALGLEPGEHVHHVRRLRLLDGEPIALESSYYSARRLPDLLENLTSGSLWDLLASRYGIRPQKSRATLSVVVVEGESAKDLSVRAGSAGMLQERVTLDSEGCGIEFARDLYRSDRAAFLVEQDL